jgi:hypothetical protein
MRYSYAGYYDIRRYGLIGKYPEIAANQDSFNDISDLNSVSAIAERRRVMDIARDVSQEIEARTGNVFMPYVRTEKFNAFDNDQIMRLSNILRLNSPAMSITSVTLGNSASLTVGTDVVEHPYGFTPIRELQILSLTNHWEQYTNQWRQAIQIAGIWGYRERFAEHGFISSGDTIQDAGGISASDTTITVSDAGAANTYGFVPRFDVGQIIRLTTDDTDEYIVILDVDYETNKLSVLRGQLGTTAAIHANGLTIYLFQPQPSIVRACAEAIAFEYANIGKYDTVQVSAVGGTTQTTIRPDIWPASVVAVISKYRRYKTGSAGSSGGGALYG